MRRTWMVGAAVMAAAMFGSGVAQAQTRRPKPASVPAAMRPPEGLCRVWVDGRAADQQDGVTDCAYARAHVPAGGRVLEGKPASARSMAMNDAYAPYYYGAEPVTAASMHATTSAKHRAHVPAKRSGNQG